MFIVSPSQMAMYATCPLKWHKWLKQSREERDADTSPAMYVGRYVHEALATFLNTQGREQPYFGPDCPVELQPEARRLMQNFYAELASSYPPFPTYTELRLEMMVEPGLSIHTVADCVTKNDADRTIIIGEHKTSKRAFDARRTVYHNVQSLVEQWALERVYPGYTVTAIVYTLLWPKGAKTVYRPLFPLGDWEERIENLAREMLFSAQGGPPMPPFPFGLISGGIPCSWCQFRGACEQEFLLLDTTEDPVELALEAGD